MKKIIVVLFVLIASQNIFAQSGWQWITPIPTGKNLWNVKFANPRVGYAVGNEGTVIKTTDGGQSWKISTETLPYRGDFLSVIDSNIVFINEYSKTMRTTNGGNNWVYMGDGLFGGNSIFFINANTGFGTNGNIYKTTNGGINWFMIFTSTFTARGMHFINEQTGFVSYSTFPDTSAYSMLRTTNQGITWQGCLKNYYANTFDFINEVTGYCLGVNFGQAIMKTTNSGLNWFGTGYNPAGNVSEFCFTSNGTGYITFKGLSNAVIYKTTNDGLNWITTPTYAPVFDIDFVSAQTGFTVGGYGTILQTTNAGSSWEYKSYKFGIVSSFNHVNFINENTGFIPGTNGTLLKTTNQGLNWDVKSLGSFTLNTTFFLNDQTGFLGGGDYPTGRLLKTSTAGIAWDTISQTFPTTVSNIFFLNNDSGYLVASTYRNPGYLFRTTNGGYNWTQVMFLSHTIHSIHFLNPDVGYFAAYRDDSPFSTNSRIYKTTNGGNNWDIITNVVDNYIIVSLKFVSENTGFQASSGSIKKTTNGGANWFIVLNAGISEVRTLGSSTVYSGSYKSTNLGNNWTLYNTRTTDIASLQYINDNTGFLVGGNAILKTTDGGEIISSVYAVNSGEVPDYFSLHQNYPNPFNPSTRINYELRNTNYVTLKVFDLLGKEVATLVNEKQNAGSYAVDFNSSEFNLPSGIYFYTLNAGEFKETRKMVLVK